MKTSLFKILAIFLSLSFLMCSCKKPNTDTSISSALDSSNSVTASNEGSKDASEFEENNSKEETQSSPKETTSSKSENNKIPSQSTSSKKETNISSSVSSKIPEIKDDTNLGFKIFPKPSSVPLKPLAESEYYGYKMLQKSGTSAEKKAYELFVKKIGNMEKTFNIDFKINDEEFQYAYDLYRLDYPQHFWTGNIIEKTYSDKNVIRASLAKMMYNGDKSKIKSAQNIFDKASQKILSKVSGDMHDIYKEIIIHNEIVKNAQYDLSLKAPETHTAYGALVNHKAVCDGYANAFQYLLRQSGIQSTTVGGFLLENGMPKERHRWNLALIDGDYYHVDLVADDPVVNDGKMKVLDFVAFNLNDSEIKKDHLIKDNSYKIPAANNTKYNFYKYFDLEMKKYDSETLARSFAFFAKQKLDYLCLKFVNGDADKAINFIAENYGKISKRANEMLGIKIVAPQGKMFYISTKTELCLMINYI